ncbi:hypothetical protein [Acinetobacter sp. BSP-28]|uniref:hypothetical protein n=1 Tax=Acinetobacter sp. BSP-28 TaxID=3344661 RepID=UPI00376FB624
MTDPNLENQTHKPTSESDQYWRENYTSRPYYQDLQRDVPDIDYDKDLSSAYEFGRTSRSEYGENSRFEDSESDLQTKWEHFKAKSRLKWEHAKHAIKDAWERK